MSWFFVCVEDKRKSQLLKIASVVGSNNDIVIGLFRPPLAKYAYRSVVPKFFRSTAPLVPYTHPQRSSNSGGMGPEVTSDVNKDGGLNKVT
jgi:hypothetical protein